jgi:hypothetical protein
LAGYGTFWQIARRRAPGYRSRLYRTTLPYIVVSFAVLVALAVLVAVVALIVNAV